MRIGSLFAGIGGFDLGLEQAGHETAWQVELDEKCRTVLERHFPRAERFADIRECGAANLAPVDVVCGGFPCQDLSVAGRRAGLSGERSGLFYEMARIVDELRPLWVVWENVPGLLSSNRGRDFGAVLVELDRIGYGGAWTVLDARYFGLAQRRRRIFGVFTRLDPRAERAAEVLALAARVRGNPPPRSEARESVAGASRVGFALRSDPGGTGQGHNTNYVANAISASAGHHGHSSPCGDGTDNIVTPALQAGSPTYERGDGSLFCVPVAHPLTGTMHKRHDEDTDTLVPTLMRQREGKPGGGKGPLLSEGLSLSLAANTNDQTLFQPFNIVGGAQQGPNHAYPSDVTGAPQHKGNAATGNEAGAVLASTLGVRRLTPTECERLQGFPDGWTEGHADSHRYRMLGNAVATPCARWIGRRLPEGDAHE